jgi:hypothetical protein
MASRNKESRINSFYCPIALTFGGFSDTILCLKGGNVAVRCECGTALTKFFITMGAAVPEAEFQGDPSLVEAVWAADANQASGWYGRGDSTPHDVLDQVGELVQKGKHGSES